MSWAFFLSPEEQHLAKIGDLDGLDQSARNGEDEIAISANYVRIFDSLSARTANDASAILSWGQRYIAWAREWVDAKPERDGLPFYGPTDWAERLLKYAFASQRMDIALEVTTAILQSYAPLEKERRWWQKQLYAITHPKDV